jgi:hypothetical protein
MTPAAIATTAMIAAAVLTNRLGLRGLLLP